MARLVNSRLLFIDSDNGDSPLQPDGSFVINMPSHGLNIKPNQHLRFTLVDFHQYKNFYNINANNNCVMVSDDNGSTFNEIRLTSKNYSTYEDIFQELGDQIIAGVASLSGGTATVTTTSLGANPSSTGDRILRLTINKTTHGITNFIVQTRDYTDPGDRSGDFTIDHNDSYALLGGKRVIAPNATQQSFTITIPDADNITITGFFPAQRTTMEHLYIRSDMVNDNYASKSYDANRTDHSIQMTHSDIFGKVAIQNEIISYTELSGIGSGYFADIFRRGLSSIRFRITDHKHRSIPEVAADQDTLGNNNFTMTLRVETYEFPDPTKLGKAPDPSIATGTLEHNVNINRRRIPF